jgi:hypothetical protein
MMRKIDLRISDNGKKLADSIYNKRAIEIARQYEHLSLNSLTFPMMRQLEKDQYFRLYAEWLKQKIVARLLTYLDVFAQEEVIPDDSDLSEMSWAFQGVVESFTAPLPQELALALEQLGRMQLIEDARRDIEIFAQKSVIKKMQAQAEQSKRIVGDTYNIHIQENRGPIQQGGSGNIQSSGNGEMDKP